MISNSGLVTQFKQYAKTQADIGYDVFIGAFSDSDLEEFFAERNATDIDSAIAAASRYTATY
ncbi:hypothetical protein F7Q91_03605 [Vibrio chagasii]|uniref:Uncharacterized protein n=1 Tax=Vibrio chagasii TaxID=170679 RepID=A0A7V7NX85_9VIBR|nr:hypothetical protein [Vibrio chagasii]KAB0482508.1 hypothetical protein F7Q91_03605 [Vibrio chagasii]